MISFQLNYFKPFLCWRICTKNIKWKNNRQKVFVRQIRNCSRVVKRRKGVILPRNCGWQSDRRLTWGGFRMEVALNDDWGLQEVVVDMSSQDLDLKYSSLQTTPFSVSDILSPFEESYRQGGYARYDLIFMLLSHWAGKVFKRWSVLLRLQKSGFHVSLHGPNKVFSTWSIKPFDW